MALRLSNMPAQLMSNRYSGEITVRTESDDLAVIIPPKVVLEGVMM